MRVLRKFYLLMINKVTFQNSSRGVINKLRVFILRKIFNNVGNNVKIINDIIWNRRNDNF